MKNFTSLDFKPNMIKNIVATLLVVLLAASCDKKFNTVGAELLPPDQFPSNKVSYPLTVQHLPTDVIQTNNSLVSQNNALIAPLQLGVFQNSLYGDTEAAVVSQLLPLSTYYFGDKTDEAEAESFDENEQVQNVWLEIPFFTDQTDNDNDGLIEVYDIDDNDPNSDSDGDGVSDLAERNNGTDPLNPDTDDDGIGDAEDTETANPNANRTLYAIDSLFGTREASFRLEVNRINQYLRDLDPNQNFEVQQPYFSNFDIAAFKETELFNQTISLDFNEVVIDEETRRSPRIRIPLDNAYFQTHFINREGDEVFADPIKFKEFFRGISIEASDFSAPLLMILNFNAMQLYVSYEYNTDAEGTKANKEFVLNASGTVKFNTITKTSTAHADLSHVYQDQDAAIIALSGGLGSVATLKLFDDGVDQTSLLEEFKQQPWLINEASITLYVDEAAVAQYGLAVPDRLFLYNAASSTPLSDYQLDSSATPELAKIIHGGFLIEEDGVRYYKIRITDHIRNIKNNNTDNALLGLSVMANINNPTMADVLNTAIKLPVESVSLPKSVILVGPGAQDPALLEQRLELELYYTNLN
jgi:hypothetical protein